MSKLLILGAGRPLIGSTPTPFIAYQNSSIVDWASSSFEIDNSNSIVSHRSPKDDPT